MRANRAHTEECRKRITECLNNDPEMKQVVDREDERMRYQIEKDEEDEKMMQTIQETGDADIEIEGRMQPEYNKKKTNLQTWTCRVESEQP